MMKTNNTHSFPLNVDSVLLGATEPGRWFVQNKHPGKFRASHSRMQRQDLLDVLRGKHWIATYAPLDGMVDRIEFDIDCKNSDADSISDRDARYWAIRTLMGIERVPLVVRTPSGSGLHVSYRIPATPLDDIIEGLTTGLVPDVLRAAGLLVERGQIEVFPQTRQAKRLPLGRRMAVLDADFLEPLIVAPEKPSVDDAAWRDFAEVLHAWHDRVYEDLVPHLENLPRAAAPRPAPTDRSEGEPQLNPSAVSASPLKASAALLEGGLTEPSTRYSAEFKVGVAMWSDPTKIPAFGRRTTPTREDVARGLALWLAQRHNGHSEEWKAALHYGVEHAIRRWTERYLQRGPDGLAPVDRMLRAALATGDDCGMVAPADMEDVVRMGEACFGPRHPHRYAFEVWTCALITAVKSILRYRQQKELEVPVGPGYVEVPILAEWMEAWPWGSGHQDGRRSYVKFRDILVSQGYIVPVGQPKWHIDSPGAPGLATPYRIKRPASVRANELPLTPDMARRRVSGEWVHGRPLTLEEGFHALYVSQSSRLLRRAYDRPTADRVRELAERIRRGPFHAFC